MAHRKEDEDGGRRKEEEEEIRLRLHVDGDNGEYAELRRGAQEEVEDPSPSPKGAGAPVPLLYLAKLAVACTCLGIVGFFIFKWLGPPFIEKVIIPMINWERETFSTTELAVIFFSSIALFPTFFLPSSPSMWMAGVTFGYGFGLLIVVPAVAVGVSLPFFIGSFFHHKIEEWLEQYPKRAAVLRAAGGGNWFHQFKAVSLIRISPFPYLLYNYCAVATNVNYWPYLCGSLLGMVPDMFASIYTGILIRTLVINTSHKKYTLSTPQIVFNVAGLSMTVSTVILFTVYAKRQLMELQKEEEPLLD